MQTQAGVHLLAGEVVNPLVLCSTITEESKDRQICLKVASAVVLWCDLNGSQSAPLTTPGLYCLVAGSRVVARDQPSSSSSPACS